MCSRPSSPERRREDRFSGATTTPREWKTRTVDSGVARPELARRIEPVKRPMTRRPSRPRWAETWPERLAATSERVGRKVQVQHVQHQHLEVGSGADRVQVGVSLHVGQLFPAGGDGPAQGS